jgi:tRNA (guanine37-N1)-methyltransferase
LRIDAITIFPDYFSVTQLSLLGKAIERGLVDLRVCDLREFGEGKHKSVDDIPYGGGPGMVMKPEPWGLAIDAVLASNSGGEKPTLIFMNPAGERFTQRTAASLSGREWLIFACGRYEGIDARVVEFYRSSSVDVLECSIGDYVVAGGESAALVVIEATTRLIPGVVGNETSVVEESFADSSNPTNLEAPAYTRPESWRGLVVPEVLRSGDHGAIEHWRSEEAKRAERQRNES